MFGRLDKLPEQNFIKIPLEESVLFQSKLILNLLYSTNSGLEAMQGIVFFSNIMYTNVNFSTAVNLVEICRFFTIPLNHEIPEQFNSAT